MQFLDKRFWLVINVLLALVVFIVLAGLFRRAHMAEKSAADHTKLDVKAVDHAPSLPTVRREVDVGHVGVRPVSFTRNAMASDASENWRIRGLQPQEWTCLPASPGMDMRESQDGYWLTFSLPGVRNEDIRLSMTGRVMTVQAVVRDPYGKQVGGMERRVLLPQASSDSADFRAIYTNGVLRICVVK